MEIKVGKRSVPIKPIKATTSPRVNVPARQRIMLCKKAPAQATLNTSIGKYMAWISPWRTK